jgi:hypothetical protein
MIVLYTPAYFDPDALYCAREYRAMLDLEARRGRLLVDELAGKSLIIPVVIRGSDELPAILSNRVFASFERDLLRASDFGKRDLTQRVEDIAKQVYLRYRALKAQPIDCEGFALPDDSGTSAWLKSNVTTRGRPMPGTGGG